MLGTSAGHIEWRRVLAERRWWWVAAFVLLMPGPLLGDCDSSEVEYKQSEGCLLLLGGFESGWVPGLGPDFDVHMDAMAAALGVPDSVRRFEPYEEHFTGMMLHSKEVHWPGLVVTIDSLAGTPRQANWLERLVLRSSSVPLPCGLAVGMPLAAFVTKLGEPTWTNAGQHGYYWTRLECRDDLWYVWQAGITLLTGEDGLVHEIQWEQASGD